MCVCVLVQEKEKFTGFLDNCGNVAVECRRCCVRGMMVRRKWVVVVVGAGVVQYPRG